MRQILIGFILIIASGFTTAQPLTQTIRGTVTETETQYPLIGATVLLLDSSRLTGVVTDVEGRFRLEGVPIGRQSLKISFVGYDDVVITNMIVTSAKEVVLNVAMKESATRLEEITVTSKSEGEAENEMASVSARSFTVEETERYAGSRGDPARMASNFAGVQGADDSRNDIVIRGNSPQSVLWRMEGINIPNPNHFNIPGTAGGPVSMINNKTLANSDFYTGAFPAEFGNSVAGVFDLKLRNGNREKTEWSGQFGFLGTEIFGEGPLTKNHTSSYLLSYRYSSLALFGKLGIDIGTSAVPYYQDAAFKFNIPTRNHGALSFFGIGGANTIDILISEQKQPDRDLYGENDRDQYFDSKAGIVGMQFKQPFNTSSFFSTTLAVSSEVVGAQHELIYRHLDADQEYVLDSALLPILDYEFRQSKVSTSTYLVKKLNKAGHMNAGINADIFFFNFQDSARNIVEGDPDYYQWRVRWNSSESALLLQPYIQWKYSISERVDIVAGLHSQFFSLGNDLIPAEPRLGLTWRTDNNETITFGSGLHSQIQPAYLYFFGRTNNADGKPVPENKKMDFTRSLHVVSGYQKIIKSNIRVKTELYYQYLFDVPVEKNSSSFSLVNTGAGFSRFFPDTLVNEGIGRNYGIELTVEKFFSRGYLFLITGSLFDAKYRGSDQVWRDTDFNGNYAFNALFSREWRVKQQHLFSVGSKVTTAGGRRYGPVNETASELEKDVVFEDATRNSLQFNPYFRFDLRFNYKINRPRVTHEVAFDLVNLLGTRNVLKLTFSPNDLDPAASPVREEYQLGFLPLFYYRIDF
jgi:hypothetical protein